MITCSIFDYATQNSIENCVDKSVNKSFDFVTENKNKKREYLSFQFLNVDINSPKCYLSLKSANSMRFRNNETNQNRLTFFEQLNIEEKNIAQPELSHSKTVFEAYKNTNDSVDLLNCEDNSVAQKVVGDGIFTTDKLIVPCITVADCVPIWFFEPKTCVFGVVHSGWKGTGIIENALRLASKKYSSKMEDFRIIIGPHIHSCCYTVDEERSKYFADNFTPSCVENGHLSLAKANCSVLQKIGVNPENILHFQNCTCCDERFGSFRRETKNLSKTEIVELSKHFTVMSAFICWNR